MITDKELQDLGFTQARSFDHTDEDFTELCTYSYFQLQNEVLKIEVTNQYNLVNNEWQFKDQIIEVYQDEEINYKDKDLEFLICQLKKYGFLKRDLISFSDFILSKGYKREDLRGKMIPYEWLVEYSKTQI